MLGVDPRPSFERAIADYDEALRRKPDFADAWGNRGAVSWHRGDAELERGGDPKPWFDRALEDFEKALRLRPKFWQVLANRALLYEKLGRLDEAAVELEKALALQPEHPGLRRELDRVRRAGKP